MSWVFYRTLDTRVRLSAPWMAVLLLVEAIAPHRLLSSHLPCLAAGIAPDAFRSLR